MRSFAFACWMGASLALGGPALAQPEENLRIYNNTRSRLEVHRNYQWWCYMDPGEFKSLSVPWGETQTFDFFRFVGGNSAMTYRVQLWLDRFREYEYIYVEEKDVP